MPEKARARGKYLVERQTGLLQGDGAEKRNIQVRATPGNHSIGVVIQGFDRIESTKLAARIDRQFEFCLDPPDSDGLVVAIVHDQHGTPGKTAGQLGLEPVPGRRGLREPGVVLGIAGIGQACRGEGPLGLKAPRCDQSSVVRAVIEVCQRIQKSRCSYRRQFFSCERRALLRETSHRNVSIRIGRRRMGDENRR